MGGLPRKRAPWRKHSPFPSKNHPNECLFFLLFETCSGTLGWGKGRMRRGGGDPGSRSRRPLPPYRTLASPRSAARPSRPISPPYPGGHCRPASAQIPPPWLRPPTPPAPTGMATYVAWCLRVRCSFVFLLGHCSPGGVRARILP